MRSTGAVAVYSKPRAVALAAAAVLLTGGAGYGLAVLTDDSSSAATTSPAADSSAPAPAPAAAPAEATRADVRDAYQRGVDAGRRRALKRPRVPLAAGTYFIKVLKDEGAGPRLGRRFSLEEGRVYALCRGGASICFRPGTIAPPG
jgi:hypothetical protein